MSERWPRVRLGEVVSHRNLFITIDDLQVYKRPRVQLHAQGIVLRDEVPGALIKTKAQQVARTGEFLVAEIDAKVGGFGVVPLELDGSIVSSHYFLFVPAQERLDPRYLDWFSKTPAFRGQVEAKGSTNYAAIRPSDVLGYEIPLPPPAEQRRIVARIEEVAAKIGEAQELERRAREGASLLWEVGARAVLTSLRGVPSRPLGELVSVCGGGTPSKANPLLWEGPIPWISPKDMKQREIWDAIDHISERATLESPAKPVDPGAVLIVVRGMILAHTVPSAILRIRAAINQDMKALMPIDNLLPEYLSATLWALNQQLVALVQRSTHDTRKLQTAALLNFCIPLPPLPSQLRVVAKLDALSNKVDALNRLHAQSATKLDAMLPAVLDRAFKGEL